MSDNILHIEPISRMGSHMLMALYGLSGSGKTLSAIKIAQGLVKDPSKIILIDTETGRGRMYAEDAPGMQYGEFTPPFTPQRYISVLQQAEAAGLECAIIDSGSHEWEGIGGLLEIAEAQKSSGGYDLKGLVKWAKPKALHNRFIHTMLTTRMHIIICLRAKEKLKQVKVNGKDEIVSEGMFPVQERNFKYDMIVQLHCFEQEVTLPDGRKVVQGGFYNVDKCPGRLMHAFPATGQLSTDTGKAIRSFIESGVAVDYDLEALKKAAADKATRGLKELEAWWTTLEKPEQLRMKPFMENFKSAAISADEEKALAEAAGIPNDFEDINDTGENNGV